MHAHRSELETTGPMQSSWRATCWGAGFPKRSVSPQFYFVDCRADAVTFRGGSQEHNHSPMCCRQLSRCREVLQLWAGLLCSCFVPYLLLFCLFVCVRPRVFSLLNLRPSPESSIASFTASRKTNSPPPRNGTAKQTQRRKARRVLSDRPRTPTTKSEAFPFWN